MNSGSFILGINLFAAGLLAAAFMAIAAYDARRRAALWLAAAYLIGMSYYGVELVMPTFRDAIPAVVVAVSILLVATIAFNAGLAAKYAVRMPWLPTLAFAALATVVVAFVQDLPRQPEQAERAGPPGIDAGDGAQQPGAGDEHEQHVDQRPRAHRRDQRNPPGRDRDLRLGLPVERHQQAALGHAQHVARREELRQRRRQLRPALRGLGPAPVEAGKLAGEGLGRVEAGCGENVRRGGVEHDRIVALQHQVLDLRGLLGDLVLGRRERISGRHDAGRHGGLRHLVPAAQHRLAPGIAGIVVRKRDLLVGGVGQRGAGAERRRERGERENSRQSGHVIPSLPALK